MPPDVQSMIRRDCQTGAYSDGTATRLIGIAMTQPNEARPGEIGGEPLRGEQSLPKLASNFQPSKNEMNLFSGEAVLSILKLIFAGSPLPEVLTIIARLVESQA